MTQGKFYFCLLSRGELLPKKSRLYCTTCTSEAPITADKPPQKLVPPTRLEVLCEEAISAAFRLSTLS